MYNNDNNTITAFVYVMESANLHRCKNHGSRVVCPPVACWEIGTRKSRGHALCSRR